MRLLKSKEVFYQQLFAKWLSRSAIVSALTVKAFFKTQTKVASNEFIFKSCIYDGGE